MIKINIPQNKINEVLRDNGYTEPEFIDGHESIMRVKRSGQSGNMSGENDEYFAARCISLTSISIYERLKEVSINGIPRIFEIITCDDFGLVIEEYIRGRNIEQMIRDDSAYLKNISNIYLIIDSLTGVLEKLGRLDPPIIHRDIKPDNIMIGDDKKIYLIDFNISREHDGGKVHDTVAMGTRGFAAPEQYGFSESDIRTDFYGLGASVKYILDNTERYQIFLPDEQRIEQLRQFVDKCMMLEKNDRFQNTYEIRNFLFKDKSGQRIIKESKHTSYTIPGFRSNNPVNMLIATVSYLLIAYVSVYAMFANGGPVKGLDNKAAFAVSIVYSIMTFGIALFFIFFVTDYRGVQSKVMFVNKARTGRERILKAVLFGLAVSLIMIFCEALIAVIIEKVLGKSG